MKKNNLIKKISMGAGILALSTIIGSGICYSKETNPQGYEIPDLSQAEKAGTRYDDLTDKIDGAETCVEQYRFKSEKDGLNYLRISKVSVNEKVFLYGIQNFKTDDVYAIADLDGDGIFETKYDNNELMYTDKSKGEFPAKKDLPPEWVLK